MDSSQHQSNIRAGGYGPSTPYMILQPANIFTFLSNFSPVIITTFVLAMSFYGPTPTFKGLIYLAFLIGVSFLRNYSYQAADLNPIKNDSCNFVRYSKFCNTTFSIFVTTFTIIYLAVPMFERNSVNVVVFALLIFYLFIDIGNKVYRGCIDPNSDYPFLLMDMIFGSLSSLLIVKIMQLSGSEKYLFYTDLQNNGVVCSRPKKQTMKCAVYKNGKLL